MLDPDGGVCALLTLGYLETQHTVPNSLSPHPDCAPEPAVAAEADVVLMLQYRDGDLRAFETLYARHRLLYRYLLRHVRNAAAAADLFQKVWSRMIATRARYEPRAKFATYLFHIAHNCGAVDHHRRSGAGRSHAAPLDAQFACPEPEVPDTSGRIGSPNTQSGSSPC